MKKIYLVLILAFSAIASFAQVTFVHNSPDVSLGKVSLWLDNLNIKDTLRFREFFTYNFASTDTVDVILKDTSGNEVFRVADFVLDPAKNLHVYVNGLLNPERYVSNPSGTSTQLGVSLVDITDTLPEGSTRVIFVHGGTDLPTIDITKFPGALLVDQLVFGSSVETILPSVNNNINLLSADSALTLGSFILKLSTQSRKTVVVLLSGFLSPSLNRNGQLFDVFDFTDGVLTAMTNVTPVINKNSLPALQLYPNPTKDNATLQVNILESGNYALQIFDIKGAAVLTLPTRFLSAGQQQWPLSLQSLSPGAYLLLLNSQSAAVSTRLIIAE